MRHTFRETFTLNGDFPVSEDFPLFESRPQGPPMRSGNRITMATNVATTTEIIRATCLPIVVGRANSLEIQKSGFRGSFCGSHLSPFWVVLWLEMALVLANLREKWGVNLGQKGRYVFEIHLNLEAGKVQKMPKARKKGLFWQNSQ